MPKAFKHPVESEEFGGLFDGLTAKQCDLVIYAAEVRQLYPGSIVFREGDPVQ